ATSLYCSVPSRAAETGIDCLISLGCGWKDALSQVGAPARRALALDCYLGVNAGLPQHGARMTDADNQTEQEIKKLANEWLDAVRRRDRTTLERILADDFLISGWQPEGRLADKEFYIEDCLRPVEIQEGSYQFDRWQVRRCGETAVVNCVLEIHA